MAQRTRALGLDGSYGVGLWACSSGNRPQIAFSLASGLKAEGLRTLIAEFSAGYSIDWWQM